MTKENQKENTVEQNVAHEIRCWLDNRILISRSGLWRNDLEEIIIEALKSHADKVRRDTIETAAMIAEKDESIYEEGVRLCERMTVLKNISGEEIHYTDSEWDAFANKGTAARRIKEQIRALKGER